MIVPALAESAPWNSHHLPHTDAPKHRRSWLGPRPLSTVSQMTGKNSARHRHQENAPVRRVRDYRKICQRMNIHRDCGTPERVTFEFAGGGRRLKHSANLVAENIGYGDRIAGRIGAHQRPRQGLKAMECRINADAKSSDE